LKYGAFPIGHPLIYVRDDCPADCLAREGIIKCKVLRPRNFYHPVTAVYSLCYLYWHCIKATVHTVIESGYRTNEKQP